MRQGSHQNIGGDEREDGAREGKALPGAEIGVEALQVASLRLQVQLLPQRRPELPHTLLRVRQYRGV